jgi:hypothetical protein
MMAQFAATAFSKIRSAVAARSFTAADHQRIDLADEVFQKVDLGGDLGAADDRNHRLGRRFQRLVERVELGLHGASGIGRQLVAEAFG